jgi:hypothetical protein
MNLPEKEEQNNEDYLGKHYDQNPPRTKVWGFRDFGHQEKKTD